MNKQSEWQAKYDATHTRMYCVKLNLETDADIIQYLDKVKSKQGAIKQGLRFLMQVGSQGQVNE